MGAQQRMLGMLEATPWIASSNRLLIYVQATTLFAGWDFEYELLSIQMRAALLHCFYAIDNGLIADFMHDRDGV